VARAFVGNISTTKLFLVELGLTTVFGGDDAATVKDWAVCPVAASDQLKGAAIATVATHTGSMRILFNLFNTSTHHIYCN